jgi:hypothetical protein
MPAANKSVANGKSCDLSRSEYIFVEKHSPHKSNFPLGNISRWINTIVNGIRQVYSHMGNGLFASSSFLQTLIAYGEEA